MPVQRTLFGQPIRLQMPPRRFQLLIAFVLFLVVTLILYGPPSSADIPTYQEAKDAAKDFVKDPHMPSLPDLPEVPAVFGPAYHKPPVQPNSTTSSSSYRGAIEWLSDFKWRNPFSQDVAKDESRVVLPPLKERPPIYTFYDSRGKQDKATSEAENRLILAWRRAWWAQGFKPQVLSRAEAMKHPHYQQIQRLKLDPIVELEFMRWLAWGHMGSGILANWLALPMAKYDNPMLAFLRRKEYPSLSRIDTLQHGVFFGEGAAVNAAIKKAIEDPLFKNVTANMAKIQELGEKDGGAMVNLLPKDISVDSKANGVAYYSSKTIANDYLKVAEKINGNTTRLQGLDMLATLINSHLHLTFQETFTDGVAVVKPLPEHTTALMYGAIDIARNLTQCPTSPMPKSCPPNQPKCKPCDPEKPLKLQLTRVYKNGSTLYSIGTVPHPYTLNTLHYTRDTLDAQFLRQNAQRDLWIQAVTQGLTGDKNSNSDRLIHFKTAVASPNSKPNSLWLTAERHTQADLEWVFGFNLPQQAATSSDPTPLDEKSDVNVMFPRPGMPEPLEGVEVPDEKWIQNEEERLQKARDAIRSKDRRMQEVVESVEKWNMHDIEAWKFARAWSGRRRFVRKKWEEEEKKFAGSESKSGLGGGRWNDKR